MTRRKKLRAKIAAAGRNVSFDEVATYLAPIVAKDTRQVGSHRTFTLPTGESITIPRAKDGVVKPAYLVALDAMLARHEEGVDSADDDKDDD